MAEIAGMFEVETRGGIAARVYTPDRDIFKDARKSPIENVWLVSPSQTLLDCAGLGYEGRDLTLHRTNFMQGYGSTHKFTGE